MIKAIIFDYFGVISSDDYWRFVKQDDKTDETVFSKYADAVNLGNMHWHEFIQKIAKTTHSSETQVEKMYTAERINPLVVGLIHELHKTYQTGLLTNAHHEFIDSLLEDNHLIDIFDAVIVSSRLGIIKPNPQIFEYALQKLGVAADEVVYIDDLEKHVNAANSVGMHGICYKDFVQLKTELELLLSHS